MAIRCEREPTRCPGNKTEIVCLKTGQAMAWP